MGGMGGMSNMSGMFGQKGMNVKGKAFKGNQKGKDKFLRGKGVAWRPAMQAPRNEGAMHGLPKGRPRQQPWDALGGPWGR